SFEHRDTMGNHSVVDSGGTQRFTSGRGARHSEMPKGNRLSRGLQLWVNLPRRLKKTQPTYGAVHGRDLPEEGNKGVVVRTIAGKGSPVELQTAVRYADLCMPRATRYQDELRPEEQGLLYVADGHVRVGDVQLASGEAALLDR